jgi:hypothetical protein
MLLVEQSLTNIMNPKDFMVNVPDVPLANGETEDGDEMDNNNINNNATEDAQYNRDEQNNVVRL